MVTRPESEIAEANREEMNSHSNSESAGLKRKPKKLFFKTRKVQGVGQSKEVGRGKEVCPRRTPVGAGETVRKSFPGGRKTSEAKKKKPQSGYLAARKTARSSPSRSGKVAPCPSKEETTVGTDVIGSEFSRSSIDTVIGDFDEGDGGGTGSRNFSRASSLGDRRSGAYESRHSQPANEVPDSKSALQPEEGWDLTSGGGSHARDPGKPPRPRSPRGFGPPSDTQPSKEKGPPTRFVQHSQEEIMDDDDDYEESSRFSGKTQSRGKTEGIMEANSLILNSLFGRRCYGRLDGGRFSAHIPDSSEQCRYLSRTRPRLDQLDQSGREPNSERWRMRCSMVRSSQRGQPRATADERKTPAGSFGYVRPKPGRGQNPADGLVEVERNQSCESRGSMRPPTAARNCDGFSGGGRPPPNDNRELSPVARNQQGSARLWRDGVSAGEVVRGAARDSHLSNAHPHCRLCTSAGCQCSPGDAAAQPGYLTVGQSSHCRRSGLFDKPSGDARLDLDSKRPPTGQCDNCRSSPSFRPTTQGRGSDARSLRADSCSQTDFTRAVDSRSQITDGRPATAEPGQAFRRRVDFDSDGRLRAVLAGRGPGQRQGQERLADLDSRAGDLGPREGPRSDGAQKARPRHPQENRDFCQGFPLADTSHGRLNVNSCCQPKVEAASLRPSPSCGRDLPGDSVSDTGRASIECATGGKRQRQGQAGDSGRPAKFSQGVGDSRHRNALVDVLKQIQSVIGAASKYYLDSSSRSNAKGYTVPPEPEIETRSNRIFRLPGQKCSALPDCQSIWRRVQRAEAEYSSSSFPLVDCRRTR